MSMPKVEKEKILARFLRYARINTQSAEGTGRYPSTETQREFIEILAKEIRGMGLDPIIDQHGYLIVKLDGQGHLAKAQKIGFLAHVDTSPDASGENVDPQIIKYTGQPLPLGQSGRTLSQERFPSLEKYIGQELIVTDGTTLLGADDKAGVAALMEALRLWSKDKKTPRRPLRVAFTMDEEIGAGVDYFDVQAFDADFAYTIDGGEIGQIEHENFNAATAIVRITGISIHPGEAKGRMVNAQRVAIEFDQALPMRMRPELTEGREGFYHLFAMEGDCAAATLHYLIREHDREEFEWMKKELQRVAAVKERQIPGATIQVEVEDSYYNMREHIAPDGIEMRLARRAIEECGIEPIISPIRGGTDGARLSFMGLPCPNLFAGGHNFHGEYEYLPINSLVKACEVILKISTLEIEQ